MYTYSEAAQAALDLAKRNLDVLQHVAWLSVNQFGHLAHEVIVICAEFNTDWSEFVLELNPNAKSEAATLTASGETPITIMCITIDELSDFFRDTLNDIGFPPPPAEDGQVHLLMLTAGGHCTWIHIVPRPSPHMLS